MYRLLALLPVCFVLASCSDIATPIATPAPVNGTISRDGYRWLHQSSGGVDQNGYYRTPMTSQDAFGQDLGTGVFRMAPEWSSDGDHLLLFETQNGVVIREDWEFKR